MTAETMLWYYTAVDQRKAAEEVGDELADDLDPAGVTAHRFTAVQASGFRRGRRQW